MQEIKWNLPQYQYILPRLKGLWTHLERQKGGIGMRGPGETEIETDRRIVRNKITLYQRKNLLPLTNKCLPKEETEDH